MPEPIPRRSTECFCLVLPPCRRPSPCGNVGRLPHLSANAIFRGTLSRLQLFRYVQASQFARLTDRSHLCNFHRRAAEAFTSELNVLRHLRTHRICYPPDYRQLAERGLSPRKIRSLVGCSFHGAAFSTAQLPTNSATQPEIVYRSEIMAAGAAATDYRAVKQIIAEQFVAVRRYSIRWLAVAREG